MRPVWFLLVPALLWSVAPAGAQVTPRPRATRPMGFPLKIARDSLDAASFRQVQRYVVDSLKFDGELGAADSQRLIRSEEHTSELQSRLHLVCRLLLEKKKKQKTTQANSSAKTTADLL